MIKNIVFDIGMVLVDFQWKRQMEELEFPPEVIDFLGGHLVSSGNWQDIDRGMLSDEEVLKKVSSIKPEYERYVRKFWEHLEETIVPYDYSEQWVRSLKERGFHIFLLTNYPDSLFEANKKDRFPFFPYVDGAVVSSRVHYVKPEPEIYKTLFNTYHLKAEECVFMDDRRENVEGAKKAGMHAFVFRDYPQAAAALEEVIAREGDS